MKSRGDLVFLVTTHKHLDGARLSLAGNWANIPHPSVDAAYQAARDHAGDRPYTINRKDY